MRWSRRLIKFMSDGATNIGQVMDVPESYINAWRTDYGPGRDGWVVVIDTPRVFVMTNNASGERLVNMWVCVRNG